MTIKKHAETDEVIELQDFAQRILFSPHLEDKLYAPAKFTDRHPGQAIQVPNGPHRTSDMQLYTSARIHSKSHAKSHVPQKRNRPSQQALNDPLKRAELLHIFANHELLSLELMALALLKYPDAPRGFRMGLAQVIKDEQRHFLLYYHQIQALGLSWGSESVSDFFWRCVADAPTVHDFNTRLSLVFEQANIDFTRFYKPCMQKAGDLQSAEILEQIYHDEIKHVKHAYHWFKQWKPSQESEWENFCALLQKPLSPGRAKGNIFSVEARKKIGMSPDFIQSLKLWGGSVGRPPVLWLPHFEVEEAIAGSITRKKQQTYITQLNTSLGTALAWLSKRGDIIYQTKPSLAFQKTLAYIKGFNPEWIDRSESITDRTLGGIDTWGWSQSLWDRAERWRTQTITQAQTLPNINTLPILFGKVWDVQQRDALWSKLTPITPIPLCPSLAYTAYQWEDFTRYAEELHQNYPYIIVKANWGAAGRQMIKLQKDHWHIQQIGWIRNKLSQGVIVEPCWDRVADLSFHGSIDEQGIHYVGTMVGEVDHRGAYQGTWLNPSRKILPSSINRVLSKHGKDPSAMRKVAQQTVLYIGQQLQKEGYVGPFGIDAFLTNQASQLAQVAQEITSNLMLHPLVEVNPRWTMGRLALQLKSLLPYCKQKVQLKCVAYHQFVMPNNTHPVDDQEAYETLTWLEGKAWTQFNDQSQWVNGILPICDFEQASNLLLYLEKQ